METLTGIAIIALAKQMMDLLKYVTNREWNGVITIVVAWLLGMFAVILVSASSLGKGELFGVIISNESFLGQLVIGMIVGSATGLAHDTLKAINNKSDASKPALIPGLVHHEVIPQVTESPALAPVTGETDNPDA